MLLECSKNQNIVNVSAINVVAAQMLILKHNLNLTALEVGKGNRKKSYHIRKALLLRFYLWQ